MQLYEVAAGIVALVVWWRFVDRRRTEGHLFLLTLAVYAGGRLLFDAFRANTPLTAEGYHLIQIASLIILLVSVFLLGRAAGQDENPVAERQG